MGVLITGGRLSALFVQGNLREMEGAPSSMGLGQYLAYSTTPYTTYLT